MQDFENTGGGLGGAGIGALFWKTQPFEVKKVVDFEQAMQSHVKSQQSDLIEALNRDQAYDDDVAEKLHAALKDFKTNGSW